MKALIIHTKKSTQKSTCNADNWDQVGGKAASESSYSTFGHILLFCVLVELGMEVAFTYKLIL